MIEPTSLESQLIREAFEAGSAAPVVPNAPVAELLSRGRRARRTRRALVAGSAVAVLAACGSAVGLVSPGQSARTVPVTSAPTAAGSGAPVPVRTFDPAHYQLGPAHPLSGVRYPFDLFVHCGIHYTDFAGRSWQTAQSVQVPKPTKNATTGITQEDEAIPGFMTLVNSTTARFESAGLAVTVVFHAMDRQAPLCS
jgi:hypothetical protein